VTAPAASAPPPANEGMAGTPGRMARASRRRNTELGLLLFAMAVVGVYAAAVEAGAIGKVTFGFLGPLIVLTGMFLAAHLAIRWLAPYADPIMLPAVATINAIGVMFLRRLDLGQVKSKGSTDFPIFSLQGGRQLAWTLLAIICAIGILFIVRDHRILSRYAYTLGLTGIVLVLIPALLPASLSSVNGAKLWIRLGGFQIQPGEFAKVLLLAFFAYYLVRKREVLSLASKRFLGIDFPRGRDLGPVVTVWLLSLMVLVFEKDLGTSLMYFGMFVVTLYIATERSSWLIIGLLLFFGGALLAWSMGEIIGGPFGNFATRVDVWLHPFDDANDKGLQIVQSLLGLGTGGLFGAGPGHGLPYIPQLGRYVVPKVENDFIFAGVGEEIGLVGLSALLIAYLLIVQRGLRIAITVRDSFGKLLAGGLAFTLGLQIFVIIGGVTGLIPLTGQTTPFMSAGGSSLVANWLLLAMLLRISDAARRPATPGQGGSIAPPVKLHEAPTEVVQ
jgi:cell division protein FtsW (lipid II flippase)